MNPHPHPPKRKAVGEERYYFENRTESARLGKQRKEFARKAQCDGAKTQTYLFTSRWWWGGGGNHRSVKSRARDVTFETKASPLGVAAEKGVGGAGFSPKVGTVVVISSS